jgi:hypothetical protein
MAEVARPSRWCDEVAGGSEGCRRIGAALFHSSDVDVPAVPHHDFTRVSRISHLSDMDEAPHVTTRKAKDPPSPLQLAREPRPPRPYRQYFADTKARGTSKETWSVRIAKVP